MGGAGCGRCAERRVQGGAEEEEYASSQAFRLFTHDKG